MNIVKLKLENCYGIKKLDHTFDYSRLSTYAIYAPNGSMKTSFAKTFRDLNRGEQSRDLAFIDRITSREINNSDGSPITAAEVFVIEPYLENFNSEKMSTLLVSKDLKTEYDSIHLKLDEEKDKLLTLLKPLAGTRNETEDEISESIVLEKSKLFAALGSVEKEVSSLDEPTLSDILYTQVFNDKVIKFLNTKDFKNKLSDYIEKYNELIEASKYFSKGVFNHNNASAIAKTLVDNGFFKAQHSISLNSASDKSEINSQEELERVIEEEKNIILKNPDLVKAFDAIDKELNKNKELRDFREYLQNNIKILVELNNLPSLRRKIWISYLKTQKEQYLSFIKIYQACEADLANIIALAKKEKTKWLNVINIFNTRFSVPFILTVENQDDVILKQEVPSISFVFKEASGNEASVDKSNLMQILSNGEKRALYLLNVIFEVEARKTSGQETLFVVDDIADSFDYKNKYAIIQYLKEIASDTKFKQIILTHNFDFFRTIESRDVVDYSHCLMVNKTDQATELFAATYIRNPFQNDWVKHFDDDIKLAASIPFVRNLVEYTRGVDDPDYEKLTSLLHIKSNTLSITKADLKTIFEKNLPNLKFSMSNKEASVVERIYEIANDCLSASDGVNLENKVLLSIAARLKAEQFMFGKLTDKSEVDNNQTSKLFERYRNEFGADEGQSHNIEVLEQVNLVTPENIHFNSFMYEPILDISDQHLRQIYKDTSELGTI
jgi:hypothetical protein